MSDRSMRVMLGAGLVVLAAQLVVWLTPVSNLVVDTAENQRVLNAGGKSRAAAPSALRQDDERGSSEVVVVEPPTAPDETVAQVPTLPGAEVERDVSGASTEDTPPATNETVAQAPSVPEPEVERDVSEAGVEKTPTATDETLTQAPTKPEVTRDVNEADAKDAPTAIDETVAQAPTVSEPVVHRDLSEASTEDTPPVTNETVAQAPSAPEPEVKRDVSEAGTGEMPSATDETQAGASSAEIVLNGESLKRKLSDPTLRNSIHADDLAALEAFYAGYNGPARWVTSERLTPQAQSIAKEMSKAEDWGLDANALQVPPPDFRPTTAEDQAAVEVALDVAILKYARAAQGGPMDPSAASNVFDQASPLREPQTVLTEITAASAPGTYLTGLHPKHEQFARLRQALLEAQSEEDKERLKANMDRWRRMPQNLGETYVWLNIPEFMLHVVKEGKTIKSEKIVVGNSNSKTPALSADMTSIVFNPERIVPTSIIRKSVLPELRKSRGLFGGRDKSVLEQYQLEVRRNGKPIDPSKVDWGNVELSSFTFVQAPGPTNTLGKVQFLFPNPKEIDLHETILPGQLKRAVRAQGERSPRVGNPEELAGMLLAEDKNWGSAKVAGLVADGKTKEVKLDNPIPVHLTYFTVVVGDDGKLEIFDDVYHIDAPNRPEEAAAASPPVAGSVPIPARKPNGGFASRAQ